jgi:hypothetical protein
MPVEVTTAIFFGGVLSQLAHKRLARSGASNEEKEATERQGILFASGLIAGEALVGILLAIPFVFYQSTNVFRVVPEALVNSTDVFGLLVTIIVMFWFYQIASKIK